MFHNVRHFAVQEVAPIGLYLQSSLADSPIRHTDQQALLLLQLTNEGTFFEGILNEGILYENECSVPTILMPGAQYLLSMWRLQASRQFYRPRQH